MAHSETNGSPDISILIANKIIHTTNEIKNKN
jgi:hypothetical protein